MRGDPRLPDRVYERHHPTEREYEVLRLLARGMTQQRAADVLGVSRQTVKGHVAHVTQALGVGNVVEAFVVLGWLVVPAGRAARRCA